MNASEFVDEIRDLLNDPNGTAYSQAECLRYLSSYQERFFARARCANEELFTVASNAVLSETDFTTHSGDQKHSYAPFDNFRITNIMRVWINRGGNRERLLALNEDPDSNSFRYDEDRDHFQVSPMRYELVGGNLDLYGHLPASFTIDIEYERIPPRLFVGKVSGVSTSGGNATFDLVYADNPVYGFMDRVDGRHVGTRIQCLASDGPSQVREIIGFVAGASAVSVTLRGAAAEIADTDQIATIPGFPEDFHRLLALGAAALAAGARGASKRYSLLKAERDESLMQAIVLLEQRSSAIRNVYHTG